MPGAGVGSTVFGESSLSWGEFIPKSLCLTRPVRTLRAEREVMAESVTKILSCAPNRIQPFQRLAHVLHFPEAEDQELVGLLEVAGFGIVLNVGEDV